LKIPLSRLSRSGPALAICQLRQASIPAADNGISFAMIEASINIEQI
jgi:hypothetical protein